MLKSIAHDHPDTTWQGTEIAYNLIYSSRKAVYFPWEFETATRSYVWPVALIVPVQISLLLGFRGLAIYHFLRLLGAVFSLLAILSIHKFFNEDGISDKIVGTSAAWVFALFYPIVYMSSKISVDAIAITLTIMALLAYKRSLKPDGSAWSQFKFGLLLGVSITIRHQFVLFWVFVIYKFLRLRKYWFFLGMTVGILPLLLTDLYYYGIPGISLWNFFNFNVVQNKSGTWGTHPWYYYELVILPIFFGFAILLIIRLIFLSHTQINNSEMGGLLLGILAYIVIFHTIPVKEITFIYPGVILLLCLAFNGIPKFIANLRGGKLKHLWRMLLALTLITSFLGLAFTSEPDIQLSNLWLAQEYVLENFPDQSLGIMGTHADTGGNLLQFPNNENERFFRFHLLSDTISDIQFMDLIILNSFNNDYILNYKIMMENCSFPVLLKEYKEVYVFRYMGPIGDELLDFSLQNNILDNIYKAEVWSCQLFKEML